MVGSSEGLLARRIAGWLFCMTRVDGAAAAGSSDDGTAAKELLGDRSK
jgi:hypothetical protein